MSEIVLKLGDGVSAKVEEGKVILEFKQPLCSYKELLSFSDSKYSKWLSVSQKGILTMKYK